MGQTNYKGNPALSIDDTAILTELLDECFETRIAIDTRSGTSLYSTLSKWVQAVAILHFHTRHTTTPDEDKVRGISSFSFAS
jgi:hypothetical protein